MEKILLNSYQFDATAIALPKAPLLIISCSKGLLACGYVKIETANKLGEIAAIVTGVKNFADMLNAKIQLLSEEAKKLNLSENATGRDFLLALVK